MSEDPGIYMERMEATLTEKWAQAEGKESKQELRAFLLFFLDRLLFATKGSLIPLRYLTLIGRLEEVGGLAWGAAMLTDLFLGLATSPRETGISGFNPFLQVCIGNLCP